MLCGLWEKGARGRREGKVSYGRKDAAMGGGIGVAASNGFFRRLFWAMLLRGVVGRCVESGGGPLRTLY